LVEPVREIMDARLLREVNRLFDELIHDPWRRMFPAAGAARGGCGDAALVLEIPLQGNQLASIALSAEGRRMTVVLATAGSGSGESPGQDAQEYRQAFDLPEGAMPKGFEARLEGGVLRLRVELQRREG
jgi:HSP20 family molecular chaperone IbpA